MTDIAPAFDPNGSSISSEGGEHEAEAYGRGKKIEYLQEE